MAANGVSHSAEARGYLAYISYRHEGLDRKAAEMIQERINGYTIPKELRRKPGMKKLGTAFRDEEERPYSRVLPHNIKLALDSSEYLILICSPEHSSSEQCEAELLHFLQKHDRNCVLSVLIDGDPAEAFPPVLLNEYDEDGNIIGRAEPLAADISDRNHGINKKAFPKEMFRILAPMLGVSFDDLLRAEKLKWNPLAFLKASARTDSRADSPTDPDTAGSPPASVLSFSYSRPNQTIRFFREDLTDTDRNYDVIVCSAYKGMYEGALFSLIGTLERKRDISVKELSKDPELNMRELGGWLSRPIEGPFRQLLCVELTISPSSSGPASPAQQPDLAVTLKSSFLTLRNLLERASLQGTDIRRIALPILGAGYQQIDIEYIAPPLFTQCVNMLKTIPSLETIDFYEFDPEKHTRMVTVCNELAAMDTAKAPDLFISYSSAQTEYAHRLCSGLKENGIMAWIAPESIPTGSNYIAEIPRAISSVRAMVLLLTEESQRSRWVQKEAGSAIGAGKLLLPMAIHSFQLTPEMSFLLEGEQFYPVWKEEDTQQIPAIIREVRARLQS